MATLIFVYGTLKDGFSRSNALASQRYIGTAISTEGYGMYAHGGYPALVDKTLAEASNVVAAKQIYGELYEVDDICLQKLDKIECVDVDLFERKIIHLDLINMTRLPFFQNSFDLLNNKQAQAYFFKRSVSGCANCGSFWPRR